MVGRVQRFAAVIAVVAAVIACGGSDGDNDDGASPPRTDPREGSNAATTLDQSTSITGPDVVGAFQAAGLEAESTRPMSVDDYGLAPFVCDGTRFFIPSLGEDQGGRIFICPNDEDLALLRDYYEGLARESAAFFSWVFVKDSVLVQINGDLDDLTAAKYEAAIP